MKLLETIKNNYLCRYRIAQQGNLFFVEERMFVVVFPYWYGSYRITFSSYIEAERYIRSLAKPKKKIIKYLKPYKCVELDLDEEVLNFLGKICEKENKIIDEAIEEILKRKLND